MEFCDDHKTVAIERYCIDCCKAICYRCATSSLDGLHSEHRVEHSTFGLAIAKLQYIQRLEQCRKLASSVAKCSSDSHNVYNCTCDSTGLEHDCQCSTELTDLNSLIDSIIEKLETTRVNMSIAVLRACQTAHGAARFRSIATYQAPIAPTNADTIKYTRKLNRADVEASVQVDALGRRHLSGIANLENSLPDAANLDNHYEVGLVLRKLAAEIAVIDTKLRELQNEPIGYKAVARCRKASSIDQVTPSMMTAVPSIDVLSSETIQKVQRKTQQIGDSKMQLESMHDKLESMHKLAKTLQRSSVFIYRAPELVLVAGGNESQCESAILRFIPDQTQWTQVSSLLTPRYKHAVATLNHKVIVAGGRSGKGNVLTSVEQFDTRSSTTTTLASLQVGRCNHALVSTGGSVYALGGYNEEDGLLSSVEQYSAENNEWVFCANLGRGRSWCAATASMINEINKSIVIAGGVTFENQASSSCELYNPLFGSKSIASLNVPRFGAVAACLAGSVYVFGGGKLEDNGLGEWDTVEQYSIEFNTWTLLRQRMADSRGHFAASCLNEKVYLIGGTETNLVEVFDGRKHLFEPTTPLPYELLNSAATAAAAGSKAKRELLSDSAIYVIGGIRRRPCHTLVAIEPTENLRFDLSPMLVPRYCAASIVFQGKFIVTGGLDSNRQSLNSAEVFDIETKKWTKLPSLNIARAAHTLAVLGDTIYAIGGIVGNQWLDSVEKLRIGNANNKWTKAPDLLLKRSYAASVTFDDAILVICGGTMIDNKLSPTSSCEMYFPESGSIPICSLVLPRYNPLAMKYGKSVFVIGGEEDYNRGLKSVEQYNSLTDQWTLVENLPYCLSIYAHCHGFGGFCYSYCSNSNTFSRSSLKIYDPEKQSFTHVTRLPFSRVGAALGCVSVSEDELDQLLNSVEKRDYLSKIASDSSYSVGTEAQTSESKFASWLKFLTNR